MHPPAKPQPMDSPSATSDTADEGSPSISEKGWSQTLAPLRMTEGIGISEFCSRMIEAQSQTNETTWTNLGKASPHHFRRSEWVEEDGEPSRTSLPRSQPLAKPAYPGKFP